MSRVDPIVYLSGPICGHTKAEAQDWRVYAQKELWHEGITVFSPLRYEEYLMEGQMLPANANGYDGVPIGPHGITVRDRYDTMTCDLMLVSFLESGAKPSFGTMIEIGWADAARIPIVVAIDADNIHNHPMVQAIAGYIVESIEDAVKLTKAVLLP